MSKSNGLLLPFILLLVFTTVLSPKSVVFGSSVPERNFNRIDPLNHFKRYTGGYDLRNKHYWASAVFTGVHGYAMGGVWLFCGSGFGIFMVVRSLCCSSSAVINHSDSYYFMTFLLILLFTSLAIVAASSAIVANQRSLHRMKKMKETILEVGVDADQTIRKVSKTMEKMQNLLLPYDLAISDRLNLTTHKLENESQSIRDFVSKNGHSINLTIRISYLVHLGMVALDLVLLVAALVLLLLHWHPGFIMIIFFCWILTALCWVLTGLDFFIHTLGQDTCSALGNFEQNPQNNSLNSILPCGGSSLSNKVMQEVGYTIHNFINQLNLKVTALHKMLREFEEDDLLGFSEICDPFSGPPNYSYIPEKCPKDSLPIGKLPNVLEKFICYNENSGRCEGVGKFLPEETYNMAWAYSNSIQDLLNIFPDLQSLTKCSFVRVAFSRVVEHQCRPFKISILWLWASMLSLSILMVMLVLIWVVRAFLDRGRSFSRHSWKLCR